MEKLARLVQYKSQCINKIDGSLLMMSIEGVRLVALLGLRADSSQGKCDSWVHAQQQNTKRGMQQWKLSDFFARREFVTNHKHFIVPKRGLPLCATSRCSMPGACEAFRHVPAAWLHWPRTAITPVNPFFVNLRKQGHVRKPRQLLLRSGPFPERALATDGRARCVGFDFFLVGEVLQPEIPLVQQKHDEEKASRRGHAPGRDGNTPQEGKRFFRRAGVDIRMAGGVRAGPHLRKWSAATRPATGVSLPEVELVNGQPQRPHGTTEFRALGTLLVADEAVQCASTVVDDEGVSHKAATRLSCQFRQHNMSSSGEKCQQLREKNVHPVGDSWV